MTFKSSTEVLVLLFVDSMTKKLPPSIHLQLSFHTVNKACVVSIEQWLHLQHRGSISVSQLPNQGGTSAFQPVVGRRPPLRLVCATSNAPFSHPPQSCSLFSLASTSGSFGRLKISLSVTKEKKDRFCRRHLWLKLETVCGGKKINNRQQPSRDPVITAGWLESTALTTQQSETRDHELNTSQLCP